MTHYVDFIFSKSFMFLTITSYYGIMPQTMDEKILDVLVEMRAYLRITAAVSLRSVAERVIDTQEKAIVFSKMDGKTSTYVIAEATSIPPRTVANWGEEFVKAGLASPPNEFFPSHRALFSLTELSVDMSLLRKRKKIRSEGSLSPIKEGNP